MQPSTPQNSSKGVFIATAVIVVAAAIYYFYYSGSTAAPTGTAADSTLSAASPSSSAIGEDVLSLLNQIHSLKIDTAFFQTPTYQSLIDFSVSIPSVNVGRSNPFSPLGSQPVTIPAAGTGQ